MSVSELDVDRVAELANLDLTNAEKASMLRDLIYSAWTESAKAVPERHYD